RTHQTINVGLNKFIKTPTASVEGTGQSLIHPHKDCVCVDWKYALDSCFHSETSRKAARRPICMLRVPLPGVSVQEPQPLGSEKTHLRSEVPGLFRSIVKLA